jgi:hypothetical protein
VSDCWRCKNFAPKEDAFSGEDRPGVFLLDASPIACERCACFMGFFCTNGTPFGFPIRGPLCPNFRSVDPHG